MNKKELIEFLKEGLSIIIEDTVEFGPVRKITVILELEGESISKESFDLEV